jgi:hypothetical protein
MRSSNARSDTIRSSRRSSPEYDSGFEPCATNPANRLQPLARTYTFFVPAPARPANSARLRYRIVNRIRGGRGTQRVRVDRMDYGSA